MYPATKEETQEPHLYLNITVVTFNTCFKYIPSKKQGFICRNNNAGLTE